LEYYFEGIWNITSPLDQFAGVITDSFFGQDENITWKLLEEESINNQIFFVLLGELIVNISDPKYSGYNLGKIYHTFWIDKTNYFLYKVKLFQIRNITGDYAGVDDYRYLEGEDIFTFYDYNIPLDIELPPDIIP
jgi:hypothetical protein